MNNLRCIYTERAGGRLLVKFSPGSYIRQCSKLTSVRQPMADNSSSGLTIFEKITFNLALMTDNILGINMKIEAFGPVG